MVSISDESLDLLMDLNPENIAKIEGNFLLEHLHLVCANDRAKLLELQKMVRAGSVAIEQLSSTSFSFGLGAIEGLHHLNDILYEMETVIPWLLL